MVSFHIEKALNKFDNDTNIQFNPGRRQKYKLAAHPATAQPVATATSFLQTAQPESPVEATENVF